MTTEREPKYCYWCPVCFTLKPMHGTRGLVKCRECGTVSDFQKWRFVEPPQSLRDSYLAGLNKKKPTTEGQVSQ